LLLHGCGERQEKLICNNRHMRIPRNMV
jgi:hypothetical protein